MLSGFIVRFSEWRDPLESGLFYTVSHLDYSIHCHDHSIERRHVYHLYTMRYYGVVYKLQNPCSKPTALPKKLLGIGNERQLNCGEIDTS